MVTLSVRSRSSAFSETRKGGLDRKRTTFSHEREKKLGEEIKKCTCHHRDSKKHLKEHFFYEVKREKERRKRQS